MRLISTLLIALGIFSLSLLPIQQAKASHAMGADISYGCLGNGQYVVILKFFRDCSGISPASSYPIYYNSGQCGISSSMTVNLVSGPGITNPQDITPLCPGQSSSCGGGGQYGVQQWVYTGTLTLPPGCGSDWVLSWGTCCRNYAITTLNSPGSQDFYVSATLNNTLPSCNTSPQFINPPVPFFCVGQDVHFNHGVVDSDGNDIEFFLVPCEQSGSTNVSYAGGYSHSQPLSTLSGVSLDQYTGEITFVPSQQQVGVICVEVREYDASHNQIGSVVRDMQVTVLNCSNDAPTASGINGTASYSTTICVGEPLCFDVVNSDPNSDNVATSSNVTDALSGATFTPAPVTPNGTSEVCWQPTTNDVGDHFFTITVQDDACPIPATNTYTYVITVDPNPNPSVNAGTDAEICAGDVATLSASLNGGGGNPVVSWTWTPGTGLGSPNSPTTTASPTSTTSYNIEVVYSDGCISNDQVTVTVHPDPAVSVFPENIVICPGTSATLTASSPDASATFDWGTGVPGATTTVSPLTTTTYTVTVTNTYGCTSTASALVEVASPPPAAACSNLYAALPPLGSAANSGLTSADPTTLEEAIFRARCNNTVIKLAIGTYTYDYPLDVFSNMTIEGGFDPGNNWVKTSQAGATTIRRSANSPEGDPTAYRLTTLQSLQSVYFELHDLTLETADAPPPPPPPPPHLPITRAFQPMLYICQAARITSWCVAGSCPVWQVTARQVQRLPAPVVRAAAAPPGGGGPENNGCDNDGIDGRHRWGWYSTQWRERWKWRKRWTRRRL